MKLKNTLSSFCRRTAFFFLFAVSTVTFLQAQTVTFGQFIQRNGTQDFVFTNNTTSASFRTIPNGSPVLFTYQNIAMLPLELQGPQLAHVVITSSTTTPATQVTATDPPRDIQPFDQIFTIQIIRDTPATSGANTRRNLLTAIITPDGTAKAALAGDDLSDSVAFTASTARQNVTFTSDFLGFLPTGNRNLGLSFSSVFPLLSIGAGGFFNSFTAAGTGTFAANPAPVFNPPTAGDVSVAGRVFNEFGSGVSRAMVTLTDSNGNSRSLSTSSLGNFQFDGIRAGSTVTISVSVKGVSYAPQVISVQDNVEGLNFYPME